MVCIVFLGIHTSPYAFVTVAPINYACYEIVSHTSTNTLSFTIDGIYMIMSVASAIIQHQHICQFVLSVILRCVNITI